LNPSLGSGFRLRAPARKAPQVGRDYSRWFTKEGNRDIRLTI